MIILLHNIESTIPYPKKMRNLIEELRISMTDGNIDDTVGSLDGGAPIVSVLIPISFGSYLHMSFTHVICLSI